MADVFDLWRGDLGFGAPVHASLSRPFHPLGILGALTSPAVAQFVAVIAVLWIAYLAVRRVARPAIALTIAIAAAADAIIRPEDAYVLLAMASIFWSAGRFRVALNGRNWALLTLIWSIAMLGLNLLSFAIVMVIVTIAAFAAIPGERITAAIGEVAAILIAALLTSAWWLPMLEMRPYQTEDATTGFLDAVRPLVEENGAFGNYVRRMPKWFCVPAFVVERRGVDVITTLRGIRSFSGIATVDHIPSPIAAEVRPSTLSPCSVTSISVAGARTTVTLHSSGWTLLVSKEAWWPGWRVYAGAQRLRPIRVNGAFVGVFVPPGVQSVQTRFRPNGVDDGMRIAVAGMILLLITARFPWFGAWRRLTPYIPSWRSIATRVDRRVPRLLPLLRHPRLHRAIPAMLLVIYSVVLLANSDAIAGGADSSGYLNQARLWREGSLVVDAAILRELDLPAGFTANFSPLGFAPGKKLGTIVPTYPIGLPLQLAIASALLGTVALKYVVPLTAIGAVALTFWLARLLGLSRVIATVVAALLALCATFVVYGIEAMSDVPATFWITFACVLALLSHKRRGMSFAAGAVFGIAVLVRPTNLLVLPAVLLFLRDRKALAYFIAGGVPFALLQARTNHTLYGGYARSGYGDVSTALSLAFVPVRFVHYTKWLALLLPFTFPLGFAGATSTRLPSRIRAALLIWFGAVFAFYCAYYSYEEWWYTRFLLPAIPPLAVLTGAAIEKFDTSRPRRYRLMVIVIAALAIELAGSRYFAVLNVNKGEAVYPEVSRMVARTVPRGGVIVAMQLSGALYYYNHVLTLRYDGASASRIRGLMSHIRAEDRAIYALVGDWELPLLQKQTGVGWRRIARVRDVNLLLWSGP